MGIETRDAALQNQKAVSAYFTSKQILHFSFARNSRHVVKSSWWTRHQIWIHLPVFIVVTVTEYLLCGELRDVSGPVSVTKLVNRVKIQ